MPKIDTSTEAIHARCDHIEGCTITAFSQDALRMRQLVKERDEALARERALLNSNKQERSALIELNTLRHKMKETNNV